MSEQDTSGKTTLALALVGALAFVGVYSPQPLLPSLQRAFGAGEGAVAGVISALALGVAAAAPWAGWLSDALGRRRLIVVASFLAALLALAASRAPSLPWLLAARFAQGCVTPAILTSAMAYAAEEFAGRSGAATSAYVTGTVAGGFAGRMIASSLVGKYSWSGAMAGVGGAMLLLAFGVAAWLPASRRFVRSEARPLPSIRGSLSRGALRGAYVVGFAALFSLVSVFTFICFRLSRPPFSLGPVALGGLFVVYLAGLPITPAAGRLVDTRGPLPVLLGALLASAVGVGVTLSTWLPAVALGLGLCACGVFVVQAATSTFVARNAVASRATASGVYLSAYYAGGAVGALLPAPLWTAGGWPAVVLLVVLVQAVAAAVACVTWR